MARGRLRQSRSLVVAHAYLTSPREDGEHIDVEQFIEHGSFGEQQPAMKYNPDLIKQIAESGLFTVQVDGK
jgi:hypothetical protein